MYFTFEFEGTEYEYDYDVPIKSYERFFKGLSDDEILKYANLAWVQMSENDRQFIAGEWPEFVKSESPLEMDWLAMRKDEDAESYLYFDILTNVEDEYIDDLSNELEDEAEAEFRDACEDGQVGNPNDDIEWWYNTQRL